MEGSTSCREQRGVVRGGGVGRGTGVRRASCLLSPLAAGGAAAGGVCGCEDVWVGCGVILQRL